jgi:hypothetical protein
MKRARFAGLAVGLLAAVAISGSTLAASPAATPGSDTAIAIRIIEHGSGQLPVGSLGTVTSGGSLAANATPAAATSCWYAYWIAEARDVINLVLFQYKEQVNWCASAGKIVSDGRFTQPITPRPGAWQFASEALFNPSYNSTHSSVWYAARGTFNHVIPTPFGWAVIGQSFPLVQITAYANGTASGSISW